MTTTSPAKKRKSGGGSFTRYLLVRFLLMFPTVFILVTLVFLFMRSTGDPITAALGGRLPADQLAERIHEAGYDRPLLVQYLEYIGQVFTGNFGRTLSDNQLVTRYKVDPLMGGTGMNVNFVTFEAEA